jgi:hypothetical protein
VAARLHRNLQLKGGLVASTSDKDAASANSFVKSDWQNLVRALTLNALLQRSRLRKQSGILKKIK